MTTLLEDWQEFERNILPADFGVEARRKTKFAFYSGALRILDKLMEGASADVNTVVALSVECQRLANDIVVDHL